MSGLVLVVGTKAFCEKGVKLLSSRGIRAQELVVLKEETNLHELKNVLTSLNNFDWGIFCSVNAVKSLVEVSKATDKKTVLEGLKKVAAVGPSTANALSEIWNGEIFLPTRYTVLSLAEQLPAVCGSAVLAFRSNLTDEQLVKVLEARGARKVSQVAAYRIHVDEAVELPEQALIALLGSPSSARAYAGLCRSKGLVPTPVACIGPATYREAVRAGLNAVVVAPEHTLESLVEHVLQAVRIE
ncbi:MAG: uroporphyrinogen-III synthase [Candidatus Caldarchaeum sp.]